MRKQINNARVIDSSQDTKTRVIMLFCQEAAIVVVAISTMHEKSSMPNVMDAQQTKLTAFQHSDKT
jgi:hypothetical protein